MVAMGWRVVMLIGGASAVASAVPGIVRGDYQGAAVWLALGLAALVAGRL